MITAIKNYLKNIIVDVTGLDETKIFLEKKDESHYTWAEWVSILTGSASAYVNTNVPMFHDVIDENNVLHKKRAEMKQSIKIEIASENPTNIDNWVYGFIKKIERKMGLNNQLVITNIESIQYSDSASLIRDTYVASLSVDFFYGVYEQIESVELNKVSVTIK